MSIVVDGKMAFKAGTAGVKDFSNVVFLTGQDKQRISAMTDAEDRKNAIAARSIESVYFLTKDMAAEVSKGTRQLAEFRIWHRYDTETPAIVWNFTDMTLSGADIRPSALLRLDAPVKLLSFTTYGSLEIKAVSDVIAEYEGEYTSTDPYDTSLCKTVGNTTVFSIDSCVKLTETTESGEDIYKTKVKVSNSDGYLILASSTNNYVFRLDHRVGPNQTLDYKYAYTNEESSKVKYLTPARQLYDWVVSNVVGKNWQGSTAQSKILSDKVFKIELELQDLFDVDPVSTGVIAITYDELTNSVSWTITKDTYDISSYVKEYVVDIAGESYSASFTLKENKLVLSELPDGTALSNGDYTFTIHAVTKQDESTVSQDYSAVITVDVDFSEYEYQSYSNVVAYVAFTPSETVKLDGIEFLSLVNATSVDSNVAIVCSYDGTKPTKIAALKLSAVTEYKATAKDGTKLYKRVHIVNSTSDVTLTAGTTYLVSLNSAQWGNQYVVYDSSSTDRGLLVKTAPAWDPVSSDITDTGYRQIASILTSSI